MNTNQHESKTALTRISPINANMISFVIIRVIRVKTIGVHSCPFVVNQ
jgi:hypothetical protein